VELEPKICANEDCLELFAPKVHNAIYCSAECRKIVTNQKVLNKYYEKKNKQAFRNRVCKNVGCSTLLSRYNEDQICGPCQVNRLKDRLEGWGWNRSKLDEEWSY
jgi:ribosomal protein S27AE